MLRIRSTENAAAAILLIFFGAAGLYFSGDLEMGTAFRMGPGYFPVLLSWCILVCGAMVGFQSIAVDGPAIERTRLRPALAIIFAILAFGLLIDVAGLVITATVVALAAGYIQPRGRLLEIILFSLALSVFLTIVFVYLLGQPMPLWPGW
jgi:putative tricarboxylic transport membrane protein